MKDTNLAIKQKLEDNIYIDFNGCWLWQGALNSKGYGHSRLADKKGLVHRISYEFYVGPVPSGLELDHLCRVRSCINPNHLEPVTHAENMRRGAFYWTAKTHCIRGHEFIEENIKRQSGRRHCIPCRKLREEKKKKNLPPVTHCYKGHEYTVENTFLHQKKRICRICKRANENARYHRVKGVV